MPQLVKATINEVLKLFDCNHRMPSTRFGSGVWINKW